VDVPCYKVASYEANDIPLLKKIARTGKPVIMSIGYATLEDVELAVQTLRDEGARDIAILHCVTGYTDTPQFENMNLRTIADLRERFGVVSGFSDNNAGVEVSILSAAMGASIIEKHFTLRRSDGGPDAKFSIEPAEMKFMIKAIRRGEKIRGTVHYGPANATEEYNKRLRRSLFVVQDIKRGEQFTRANIRSIRPAFGLHPRFLDEVLGKTSTKDIERGTPLSWGLVS
jgi:sialic acid synthase SpsE